MPAALVHTAVIATGDINTSRFVQLSTSEDHSATEANSGDKLVIGVSNEGAKEAPQGSATALHAADGDPVSYHPWGDECLITCGGTVTRGDYLKPDNAGKAVAASANDVAFALAFESRATDELVRARVMSPYDVV